MPACHAGDRRFESGRVRHLRIFLRPVRPPGRGVLLPDPRCGRATLPALERPLSQSRAMKRLPLLVVLGLLAVAIAVPDERRDAGLQRGESRAVAPAPRRRAPGSSCLRPRAAGPARRRRSPRSSPTAAPTPAPTPAPLADVAVVPVVQFRATAISVNRAEVAAVLAGTSKRYEALELVESEADAILAALGAERPVGGRPARPRPRRRDPHRGPRQAPQAPRLPPRGRGHAGGQGPGLGRPVAVRRGAGHGRRPSGG